MCGIAGYLGKTLPGDWERKGTLQALRQRGPDAQSEWFLEVGGVHTLLLHTRLAILDLDSRSNQPFHYKQLTLITNGEIYNFIELRAELEKMGRRFNTSSDTEVLAQAWDQWGPSCLKRMEGMWAFAIFDAREGALYLSRDRFGEKSLWIHEDGSGIYFASELNALSALKGKNFSINPVQIDRYLRHGYKSLFKSKQTYYEQVELLDHATYLKLSIDRNAARGFMKESSRYWTPKLQQDFAMTYEAAVIGTRTRLIDSVRLRMRADVPLAFCLSGGVDSASLASIATKSLGLKVSTFSIIDSDPRYNEEKAIQSTVDDLQCESTLVRLNSNNTLERLMDLVHYRALPLATVSYLVHSMLSEQISKAGFKVAVSGTGADELFTGYYDHYLLHMATIHGFPEYADARRGWERHVLPVVRNPHLQDPELYLKFPQKRDHIYEDMFTSRFLLIKAAETFSEAHFETDLLRGRMLNELFHEAVPVILMEDDLNSMKFSVENRSPFLDSDLLEFALSIPAQHLIRDGRAKAVLRDAVSGILNDEVRLTRQKKGFNASVFSLFDFNDGDLRSYLLDPAAELYRYVDHAAFTQLLDSGDTSNSASKFIFNCLNVRIFLQ
jgi:asparagine synthase (glutamine-hydrolysing)